MEKLPYRELAAHQVFLVIHCETPDESNALSMPRKCSSLEAKIMSAESFPFEMYQSTIITIVFFWLCSVLGLVLLDLIFHYSSFLINLRNIKNKNKTGNEVEFHFGS